MFKDLVKANRSYRGYDESYDMTEEVLLELVDCARLAPSSVNAQPFQYYLAWKKEEVNRILPLTKWARALPELTLPHDGMAPTGFIVICLNKDWGETPARYQKDIGIVAQTMLLAAAEKELGGCMIGNFNAGEVKEELNLPDKLLPVLLVALGKPAETVVLTELIAGGVTNYYRDDHDIHYVPKRSLKDIIINNE